jgi:hypothetical protein
VIIRIPRKPSEQAYRNQMPVPVKHRITDRQLCKQKRPWQNTPTYISQKEYILMNL